MAIKTTVELDPKELSHIISMHLYEKGYEVQGAVTFNVQKQLQGYGIGEQDVLTFVGAHVSVTPRSNPDYTSLAHQMSQPIEPR